MWRVINRFQFRYSSQFNKFSTSSPCEYCMCVCVFFFLSPATGYCSLDVRWQYIPGMAINIFSTDQMALLLKVNGWRCKLTTHIPFTMLLKQKIQLRHDVHEKGITQIKCETSAVCYNTLASLYRWWFLSDIEADHFKLSFKSCFTINLLNCKWADALEFYSHMASVTLRFH